MYNNYPSNGTKKICTVTAVDLTRAVCKCISDIGEILTDVRWLIPSGGTDGNSSSHHPVENSKVLVDISSGFPFILGAIPNEGTSDVRRPNIGRQSVDEPQLADYTTIKAGDLVRGPGTPRDQRPGDLINTTDGGAIQGILSSGTVINKASPLSQLICSRYGDLVRVVARNYERFSDVDKEQKVSIRGNVYTRDDLFRDPVKSRAEIPNVVRYTGNVRAAEAIHLVEDEGYETENSDGEAVHKKYTYASIPVDSFPEIPEDDLITDKTYVYNDAVPEEGEPRIPVSINTLDIEGAKVEKIQTVEEDIYMDHNVNNTEENTSFTTPDDYSVQHQDATNISSTIKSVVESDLPERSEYTRDSLGERMVVSTEEDENVSTSSQVAEEHKKEVLGGIKTNWWMNENEFQWDVNDSGTFIRGNADGVIINVEGRVVITCGSDGNLTIENTGNTEIATEGTMTVGAMNTEFNLANCTFNTSGTTEFNSSGNFKVTAPVIMLN